MKHSLINVTKNVLDEGTSKKIGKKILIATIVSDVIIVGLYGWYIRAAKKREDSINGKADD